MRVLVCGGRDYTDQAHVNRVLDGIHETTPITGIVQGGAPGADCFGMLWALNNEIPCYEFAANWKQLGRKAGPIRNQQMIDEGQPDLVIAFPGGRGTADMVRKAKAAGVRVIEL